MSSGMFGWVLAATVVHVAAIGSFSTRAAAKAPSPVPTEIDLAPIVEPQPKDEPTKPEPAPAACNSPLKRRKRARHVRPPRLLRCSRHRTRVTTP